MTPSPPSARPSIDSASSASERARRLKGIAYFSLALVAFTVLDTSAKWLTRDLPALQVTYMRYLIAFVLAGLIFNPWRTPEAWRTRRPWVQIIRGLGLFGSTFCNFMALKTMQLAETMSIIFATPFVIALLAGPILGEWIGPRRWVAVMVGFLGVLVVTQPGFATFNPGVIYSLCGVMCYATYAILTRFLNGIDSAASMLVISAVIPVILLTPAMPSLWVMPETGWAWTVLLFTGVLGAGGHFFVIKAYGLAPAPVIAPFMYTQILWMVAAGYIVFGDVPGPATLIGASIVVASGLYLLYRERTVKGEVTSDTKP